VRQANSNAAQPALAADGASRPRDQGDFESSLRPDYHLALERAAAEAQDVGPPITPCPVQNLMMWYTAPWLKSTAKEWPSLRATTSTLTLGLSAFLFVYTIEFGLATWLLD